MTHVVTSEPHICPKCETSNMGATVVIFGLYICPDCYYKKYEIELLPVIKQRVCDYFSPPITEKTVAIASMHDDKTERIASPRLPRGVAIAHGKLIARYKREICGINQDLLGPATATKRDDHTPQADVALT